MNFDIIIKYFQINNFFLFKLTLICLIFFIIIILFKKLIKNTEYRYYKDFHTFHITDFFFTFCCIVFYIIVFIFTILYLRLNRIGYSIDLKPKFLEIKNLYISEQYFILLLTFLIIICFLLFLAIILKTIKNFLELELMKIHLFLLFPQNKNILKKSSYYIFLNWFHTNLHLNDLINYFLRPLELLVLLSKDTIFDAFFNSKVLRKSFLLCYHYVFNLRYNCMLIPLIFIYDLYFNDYTISILFTFLFFYFIYVIWFKFFTFIVEENAIEFSSPAKMVYDLYYNKKIVKYSNIDEKIWTILNLFIKLNLKGEDIQYGCDVSSFIFKTLHYNRYVLINSKNNLYYNENTKKYLNINEIEEEEIYDVITQETTSNQYESLFYFFVILNIFSTLYFIFILIL